MFDANEYNEERFVELEASGEDFELRQFYDCVFERCDFSQANLSGCRFVDCTFSFCNLANSIMRATALRSVVFSESKLLGVDFSLVDQVMLEVSFDKCDLSYGAFSRLDLRAVKLLNSNLLEAQFESCNMIAADFSGSTLEGTSFANCDLTKADFSDAEGYCFDPRLNKIKGAKFSLPEAVTLLKAFDIVLKI